VLNEVHHEDVTLALDGGEWSASRPGHFTPSTHSIEGWVGLDAVARREKLSPSRKSNSGRTSSSLVTVLTELERICLKTSKLAQAVTLLTFIWEGRG